MLSKLTFANGTLHKLRIILCGRETRHPPSIYMFTSLYSPVKCSCLSLCLSIGSPKGKALQQCGEVLGYDNSTLLPESNNFSFSLNLSMVSSHCFTNVITSNCKLRIISEASSDLRIYITVTSTVRTRKSAIYFPHLRQNQ